MNILLFLKSLYSASSFEPGDLVNQVQHDFIIKSDGCVISSTRHGVLVEWPQGGVTEVPSRNLCLIYRAPQVALIDLSEAEAEEAVMARQAQAPSAHAHFPA